MPVYRPVFRPDHFDGAAQSVPAPVSAPDADRTVGRVGGGGPGSAAYGLHLSHVALRLHAHFADGGGAAGHSGDLRGGSHRYGPASPPAEWDGDGRTDGRLA